MAPTPDSLFFWLIETCRRVRELQEAKVSDIGFWYGDPSAIYRFEQGKGWPRDPDRIVAAYAKELGFTDARDLWALALDMWRGHGQAPDLEELRHDAQRTQRDPEDLLAAARLDFERALTDDPPAPVVAPRQPARKSAAKANRRAAG